MKILDFWKIMIYTLNFNIIFEYIFSLGYNIKNLNIYSNIWLKYDIR